MRKRSILAAAGLAAATIIGATAPTDTASAGQPGVEVEVEVFAPNAGAVLDDLTIEVWNLGVDPIAEVGNCSDTSPISGPDGLAAWAWVPCGVPGNGSYAIGVSGVPAGATATADCTTSQWNERIPGDDAMFVIDEPNEFGSCTVTVVQPTVFVDKIVADGAAQQDDFTIEVYSGGDQVATGTDPSADSCVEALTDDCAAITVPAGDLQLGESGPAGYVPSNVWCTTFRPKLPEQRPGEAFPTDVGEITLSDQAEGDTMAYCEITNRYYEGDLVVKKSVTNDDGGTLGPADFTAEIYTEPGGSLVTSAACAADGTCITATSLPIGDYRIGEADTKGYTATVSCSVTRNPDGPGDITTDPPIDEREAITGDDAVATVEPFGEVTCEIVNDDPTTTTTTTMAPTTTDQDGGANVPTTVAPILPPTGDDNGTMALIATLLVAIGGALLVARRRIA